MNQYISESVSECLNCKTKPCTKGCPLGNNIPEVIKLIKENKMEQAYIELTKTTVLPSVCGRVCPHMKQCMGKCTRGIKGNPVSIGNIEMFLGDKAIEQNWKLTVVNEKVNKKIAVIGSGPAGLTCAAFLARKGFEVTIYEKENKLGGLLRYGIPKFRLDREILDKSIQKILDLGINIKYECELGKDITLEQLQNEYDAIFIAVGANIPCNMNIKGENLNGVYGGNTLLLNLEKQINVPDFKNKNVVIIGGGNVAMDCARTIKRLGAATIKVLYRRSMEQMTAEEKEIDIAMEEKVEFLFQTNVVQIIGEGKVEKVECVNTKLVKIEGQNRLVPINIENSNYQINADYVIMAIGAKSDENVIKVLNLDVDKYVNICVDDTYQTSNLNVWAGGDIIGNNQTVAWACYYGRKIGENIEKKLKV